ncbi:MAG: SH3 domain-containing protein, partial [Dehalococcoidia bacterium]|nr:SH3 domain-containing protein [Dehalococcoidia bacterium]
MGDQSGRTGSGPSWPQRPSGGSKPTPPAPGGTSGATPGTSGASGGRRAVGSRSDDGWGQWRPLLRNRFVLGGLGVVVVLLLISIVLLAVGGGDDAANDGPAAVTTPGKDETAVPTVGLRGRVTRTATMRNGPGFEYAILGTIPNGASVSIVGRNEDASWLQVVYPPNSTLRGWVGASFVDVDGNVMRLALGGPGASPSVDLPPGGIEPLPTEPPVFIPELPTEPQPPVEEPTEAPPPTEPPASPPPTEPP